MRSLSQSNFRLSSPFTFSSPRDGDIINEKPLPLQDGNRRSGDEALDLRARSPACQSLARRAGASAKAGRKPFNVQLLACKPLKRLHLKQTRLPIALNDRILKLRSVAVYPRPNLFFITITTHSPMERDRVSGPNCIGIECS
jgi:hypothetical protein